MNNNIGNYEILATLGDGALGVVYKARDASTERLVAIKTLRTDILDDEARREQVQHLAAEVRAYERLHHPNIVTCYGVEQEAGESYIVMEYVVGRSLKEYLDRAARFSVDQSVSIMRQLLAALTYAHENHVIHRAITPANILLTADHVVKVMDFGFAPSVATRGTQAGMVTDSLGYMSPEQCTAAEVDERADLFAAGAVFYELLTGEKPFGGGDRDQILNSLMHHHPKNVSEFNERIPPQLDVVFQMALAKDPDERYQSAEDFALGIEMALQQAAAQQDEIAQALAVKRAAQRNAVAVYSVVAGGVVALVVAGVNYFSRDDNAVTPPTQEEYAVLSVKPEASSRSADAEESPSLTTNPTRGAVQNVLDTLVCGDIEAQWVDEGNVELVGYSGTRQEAQRVADAVAAIPGVQQVIQRVEDVAWPYCELLHIISPYLLRGADVGSYAELNEANRVHFKAGEAMRMELVAPPFDGYLYVDYFLSDGTVVHLFPNAVASDNRVAANQRLGIGELGLNNPDWETAPAVGQAYISLIGVRRPLFDEPRAETESATQYLDALRTSVGRFDVPNLYANYTVVETTP